MLNILKATLIKMSYQFFIVMKFISLILGAAGFVWLVTNYPVSAAVGLVVCTILLWFLANLLDTLDEPKFKK